MPIRARLALAAAAITLLLAGVGGVLFVRSFRSGQVDSVDRGLANEADTLQRQVRAQGASFDLSRRGPLGSVATGEVVAQILDANGRVVDATREAGPRAVVRGDVLRDATARRAFTDARIGREGERFRVLAEPLSAHGVGRVLVIGASREETDAAIGRVRDGVVIGGLAAVLVAGVGGWWLAGAALRPVDRMRREASVRSARDMTALPVPETHDEVAALGATMNELLARLRSTLQRQRDFIADAGHELRTPLAVLIAELELAGRPGRTPDELRDAIQHATFETERLARLADQLLFLATDGSEGTSIRSDPVSVDNLVDRVLQSFSARAAQEHVRLATVPSPALTVAGDEDLLRRAVDNLVDNALRYAPSGSEIEISATAANGTVQIAVRDHGPGFPEEFLPDAFERFRRADGARSRAAGGTGLGLAIVRSVAEAHGGSADARNAGDGGAVLKLTLPASSSSSH